MSIRIVGVAVVFSALILSGCVTNSPAGGAKSTSAARSTSVAGAVKPQGSVTTERAGKAALAALGAEVVETKGDYRLCSLVDHYRMCGGSPCHKGGLKATTYFVCRQSQCASREVLTPDAPAYASQKSCIAGCRKAEAQWRAKRVPLETFYCAY